MFDHIFNLIAPHSCAKCSKIGKLLCEGCIADILEERVDMCINCGTVAGRDGVCPACRKTVAYERALVVGERHDALKQVIDGYKFLRQRAAYVSLARLMEGILPYELANARLVPIPTVATHIRRRGYDNTKLITSLLARRKRIQHESILLRRRASVQYGASRKVREQQAKEAFWVRETLDPNAIYILFDDIVTTGASMKYGALALKEAGARHIWAVALARQTLEE